MTQEEQPQQTALEISIHTLRVEGDSDGAGGIGRRDISIHTLRVEGDHCVPEGEEIMLNISIHTLRVEGDKLPRRRRRRP